MPKPSDDFDDLSVAEQLQHVQELWQRIAERPESLPVSEAQLALLRERLAQHDTDPESGVDWEELKTRLLEKL